jgi:hypothetical protein
MPSSIPEASDGCDAGIFLIEMIPPTRRML